MNIRMYVKICALPLGIVLIGCLAYFFVFDSFNQQHIVTITQIEAPQEDEERLRMREELERIKQSSNIDFIHNVLSQNLNRISTSAHIEFENVKPTTQTGQGQKQKSISQDSGAISPDKQGLVNYCAYKQIRNHQFPESITNLNSTTSIDKLTNTSKPFHNRIIQEHTKIQWAIPTTKEVKIYHTANIQSRIIAINKNGKKMQVIDTSESWAHVRYAIKKETFVEGYIPIQHIRFVR